MKSFIAALIIQEDSFNIKKSFHFKQYLLNLAFHGCSFFQQQTKTIA